MKKLVLFCIASILLVGISNAAEWVNGYFRRDGTYVPGHWRSERDANFWNNWSSWGNINPYTGKKGYRLPKLEDYLQKPSYYNYTFRPFEYYLKHKSFSPTYEDEGYNRSYYNYSYSPQQYPMLYYDRNECSSELSDFLKSPVFWPSEKENPYRGDYDAPVNEEEEYEGLEKENPYSDDYELFLFDVLEMFLEEEQ